MTPKEHAIKLVEKMLQNGYPKGRIGALDKAAVRCALVAVNEILNQDKKAFDLTEAEYHIQYWSNVKDELLKMK